MRLILFVQLIAQTFPKCVNLSSHIIPISTFKTLLISTIQPVFNAVWMLQSIPKQLSVLWNIFLQSKSAQILTILFWNTVSILIKVLKATHYIKLCLYCSPGITESKSEFSSFGLDESATRKVFLLYHSIQLIISGLEWTLTCSIFLNPISLCSS